MVDIYIARHGQDEDNAAGRLNGHRDTPLTVIGRAQAAELAKAITTLGLEFQAVYSSPLQRALQTAEIVGESLRPAIQPIVLAELIERDFGDMTGKYIKDIASLPPEALLYTDTITYFIDSHGGETFPQLLVRTKKLLISLRDQYNDGNILIVCHGDTGKMLYAAATGKDWKDVLTDFHFGNGELIELDPNKEARLIRIEQHNV
jgi:broad specificity phosphatase PhoE